MLLKKTFLVTLNVLLSFLFCIQFVKGQERVTSEERVTFNAKSMPLAQVLTVIEKQTSYKFAYSPELISSSKNVKLEVQNMPLTRCLAMLFRNTSIGYTVIGKQIVLQKIALPQKITISGYVRDKVSGEFVPEATVFLPALKQSAATNNYGFYSITVPETDRLVFVVSHADYNSESLQTAAVKSAVLNFHLTKNESLSDLNKRSGDTSNVLIKENLTGKAEIKGDSLSSDTITQNVNLAGSGDSVKSGLIQPVGASFVTGDTLNSNSRLDSLVRLRMSNKKDNINFDSRNYGSEYTLTFNDILKTTSSLGGNRDILNSIQLMPGIMAGLETSSGFFVRGGNADQNLVQLDEATLYNPNHFFGLVSIFNTSIINNALLLKDGFPASYGGHLSSLLAISTKEGNNQKTEGEILAGTNVSGVTINGPIAVNKASYLLSVRRSTLDVWLRPLQSDNNYNNYYFYDVNAKVNYQLSQNDHVYLSLYQGRDHSLYSRDTTDKSSINYGLSFGNQALTLRWNHLFSQKVFSNTTVVYNQYFQSISASQKPYYAQLYSGIRDIDFKTDLNYYPDPHHKISGGISYLYQTLMPASVSDQEISTGTVLTVNPANIPQKYSFRFAPYLGDDINVGQRIHVYLGIRLPVFYTNNATYVYLEPRFFLFYLTSPSSGFKITYTKTHQYLHLVKSYNASFPAEIWIGSSPYVKPENSGQVSGGVYKNFRDNMFQTSWELYYKEMGNQLLFKGGIQPTITSDIENMLIFGKGESYGSEVLMKKMKGKLTGWAAYTLSYATQQFDSLNLGNSFPFAGDRRHCIYLAASYAFNEHWEISSNFVFTSGRAFTFKNSVSTTLPGVGKGLFDNENAENSSGKGQGKVPVTGKTVRLIEQNNYRLDPYDRLDLSVSYKKSRVFARRTLQTEWMFSVYNLYARNNSVFAYRSIDPVTLQPTVQQVSLFPIIPSIAYRLKF